MTLNELSNASALKKKFLAADYPHKLINSVINTFTEKGNEKEEEYLILLHFFKIPKPVILIEIPFCVKNEIINYQITNYQTVH